MHFSRLMSARRYPHAEGFARYEWESVLRIGRLCRHDVAASSRLRLPCLEGVSADRDGRAGCRLGPGTITLAVADVVSPGTAVGIDLTDRMIEEARLHAEHSRMGNIGFQVGDAYQLDFADPTFDLTYSQALIG